LRKAVAAGEPALIAKPVENTPGRMALFARDLQVLIKPPVDRRNERIELRPGTGAWRR
jgi:hypothetical protein